MIKLYQNIPSQPGIYQFKDEHNAVLYVGKAKNLKSRVGSYFTKDDGSRPWIRVMVGLIRSVETIVVSNELEALILESTLIKQLRPKFNVKLVDDKTFPYIKLTRNESYPRFQIVRKIASDGQRYFGPYLSARGAGWTCEFLRRLYGVHLSNSEIKANRDRPCLNCQLEGNLCPYNDEISPESYQANVEKAVDFLQGKRRRLVNDIADRMEKASKKEQFELAAKLRDQLRLVKHIITRQQVASTQLENYDAIAVATNQNRACLSLLRVRQGQLSAQHYFFYQLDVSLPKDIVRQFLIGLYFNFPNLPALAVIGIDFEDRKTIEQFLKSVRGGAFELRVAERGEKIAMLELAHKNAQSKLEMELLRSDQSFKNLIALKELLDLAELPQRIEAVDISNLGSSEAVGATVCFINGRPDKNEYRRYKIKTVRGQNDFAMIEEVTKRRFSDTTRAVPDLFVVDGGPEQLKAAMAGYYETQSKSERQRHQLSAIGNQGRDHSLKLIALAKKPDRVFLVDRKTPIAAPSGSKGLLLLARIRDEVHRFGITFQRSRQRRRSIGKTSS
jgi:excinuclease ABC subunit C